MLTIAGGILIAVFVIVAILVAVQVMLNLFEATGEVIEATWIWFRYGQGEYDRRYKQDHLNIYDDRD